MFKNMVLQWPAEAIWEQLAPHLPGLTVEILPEIDSTNTELMRRAKAGQLEPILLVAERQTAGRGRLGRDWHTLSQISESTVPSLTFSLGLPLSPLDLSGLSLAVGVSLAQSLHPNIKLKWPNDLWLSDDQDERKLGGILIETTMLNGQRFVVVGVGINIHAPTRTLEHQLRTPPTCLQALRPSSTAPAILQGIMLPLVETIKTFEQAGFAPFQAPFNALDVLRNRQVILNGFEPSNKSDQPQTGKAVGVNKLGALLVLTNQGEIAINSGEISVRPR